MTGRTEIMKVLKTAEQQNCFVDTQMYNESELNRMENEGNIESFIDCDGRKLYRVYLSDAKEIKVIYHKEWGFYCTVVVLNNGNTIFVNLD